MQYDHYRMRVVLARLPAVACVIRLLTAVAVPAVAYCHFYVQHTTTLCVCGACPPALALFYFLSAVVAVAYCCFVRTTPPCARVVLACLR